MKHTTEALNAFKPPFRYLHGYIWDSEGQMVADNHVESSVPALRVRGWGYLQKLPEGAAVQDALGDALAEAMTLYWTLQQSLQNGGQLSLSLSQSEGLIVTCSRLWAGELCSVQQRHSVASLRDSLGSSAIGSVVAKVQKALQGEIDAYSSAK